VKTPALADEHGVYYTPPAPRDPVPMYAAGIAVATAGVLLVNARRRNRNRTAYGSTEMLPLLGEGEHSSAGTRGEAVPRDRMNYDIYGRKP
jgi:hypothetical protein